MKTGEGSLPKGMALLGKRQQSLWPHSLLAEEVKAGFWEGGKNRKRNKKEFKINLMVWGQIHSRPELCLGISPLFLMFPDVLPWNDGLEADEPHAPMLLYIPCHASTALPAHKTLSMTLGKCPPLSQVLTHFPEMWAALSPASNSSSRWHTVALHMSDTSPPGDSTLAEPGAFMEQGGCMDTFLYPTLEVNCKIGESWECARWLRRKNRDFTMMSHTYTNQTALVGGIGW